MDPLDTKPLVQSATFQWLLATFIVYLVQRFGLPALPAAVQGEFVSLISVGLDIVIPAMLAMAARARVRAYTIIEGMF
jgi:adenylyl- and sulfurtransferase ThiI